MEKLKNLPKPTLLTSEEFKELLKTHEQLNCGSRRINDKNCSNCIHYHCEPMQGGSVNICTAKKGEFYGSYVIKNINNICPKYETPFIRKNKKEKLPTFEECIKEWEEKGYEYYKGKNHIHFRYLNERGSYDKYIFHPTELYYVANNTKVTFEMFQLISKTLKALKVKNNE